MAGAPGRAGCRRTMSAMVGCGLNVILVDDPDLPELLPYANQRDAWLRARHNPDRVDDGPDALTASGLFMAEGALVVEHLIESPFGVESVLVSTTAFEKHRPLLDRLEPGTPVYLAPPELTDRISGYRMHRGLLACGRRGRPISPAELLDRCDALVVMEDLANHDNVGGIFRNVSALMGPGAGVLLTSRTCDPLYRKALRVSMGHALRVPFAETGRWPGELDAVRAAGFALLALTTDDASDISEIDRGALRKIAIMVGAEGPGLSRRAADKADLKVRIPMAPGVDSLNVSVATGIAMHRLWRV
ncbi:MAG: RNA methyltransferase [Phycisphaerales bacterium]|nr:MAG: RNA methyltransferase [Phycisphaerales bacterium]